MARYAPRVENEEIRRALNEALSAGALDVPDSIRAVRALHGLSQVELAAQVGLSVNVIKSIESGKGNPELASLNKLAEFAGLRVALVRPAYQVRLFDPAERRAEEDRMRAADWAAIESGIESGRERDERNAMHIGEVEVEWPKID